MIDHLDRIEKLGFDINLNWNKSIDIIYNVDKPIDFRILFCGYDSFLEPTYDDIVETSCDFFYMWYNKNLETLKDYEIDSSDYNFDKLVDTCLGDITKKVYRDFNLDNLLD